MCGTNPETRMEKLILQFDSSLYFQDDIGNNLECDPGQVAKVLGTTSQVAGKVMRCFDDLWKREGKSIEGRRKIIYVPISV